MVTSFRKRIGPQFSVDVVTIVIVETSTLSKEDGLHENQEKISNALVKYLHA